MTRKSTMTRTVNGPPQFCRGGLEAGKSHLATTYTTLDYGGRVFHFCDEHPADVATPEGEPYDWRPEAPPQPAPAYEPPALCQQCHSLHCLGDH